MKHGGRWYAVVTYDVSDDRRRAKIAEVLSEYGRRVQFSVFDCLVDDAQFIRMRERILEHMDRSEDSVRYYQLCARCERGVVVDGCGDVVEDESLIFI